MSFNYSPKIVTNGLVLCLDAANQKSYPGSGTIWYDLTGNFNNGTLINGPTFSSDNGGSIVFDGIDDYTDCGTFTGLGSSNRTINVWFKIISLSVSGNKRIISLATDNTSTDTPAFTLGYSTTLTSLNIGLGGNPYNGYLTLPAFTLNTWINICGSINSNTISVYVNGNFFNNATNTGTVGANPIVYLGRYNNFYGQYGNINIAQTSIYNRALSAQEVLQNYNATKTRFGL
jgi:hypothetical protein